MNKETLNTGPATTGDNVSGKKIAAPMEGNSALQSTTPKSKLKRNRTVLCVYCYQKPSIQVWWSTIHEDHCMRRSCQPCHKRKQQCDRAHPCQRCVKRKSEDECHYDPPKRLRISQDIMVNGNHAEQSSEGAAQFGSLLTNGYRGVEPTSVQAAFGALLTLVQASGVVNTSPHLPQTPTLETNDPAVQDAATALGQLSQQGPCNSPLSPSDGRSIPRVEIQSPGHSAGSSYPPTLIDIQSAFPTMTIVTSLLDHYFQESSVQWLWPVIHRPAFDNTYLASQSGSHHPTLDFHALVAMLCACALQFLPDTDDTRLLFLDYPLGRHILRQRLHDFSRSVLTNVMNLPPTVERIQALVLHALYYEIEADWHESYYFSSTAIRMAQIMGMNRDSLVSAHKLEPLDAEVRRRLWWILFTLDRFQCVTLHRPYMILDQHCDVTTPLNLDQAELRDVPNLQGNDLDQPTEATFQILQSRWAHLIGGMWDRCFCTKKPTYQTIIDIEAQVKKFELDLPESFRLQSTRGAMARPYLKLQNQTMTSQIYHARILLLRPHLFIRSAAQSRSLKDKALAPFHVHARTVCVAFCKRLLALQQTVQTQVPLAQLRWSSIVSRIFDSALMLALVLVMDPNDNQNEELDEWISLAEHLVKDLNKYNIVATKCVEAFAAIRRRTRLTLSRSADDPTLIAVQYNERATQVLVQPQPSLSDFELFTKSADNSVRTETEAEYFSDCFPSIESMCVLEDPGTTLDEFFDRYTGRQ